MDMNAGLLVIVLAFLAAYAVWHGQRRKRDKPEASPDYREVWK